MAIPNSSETARTLELRKIVEDTETQQVLGWPKATAEDFTLFGRIIHIYSGFDFLLRYIVESMDKQGMLEARWAGKTQKLTMAATSEAVLSSSIWIGSNKAALEQIDAHRRVRNLVAHFIARRFPNDDAFVFITKSTADFKRVYGKPSASIDTMLYGVADAQQLRGIVPELENLLKWLAKVLADLSKPLGPINNP